jgi:hypothetical protein
MSKEVTNLFGEMIHIQYYNSRLTLKECPSGCLGDQEKKESCLCRVIKVEFKKGQDMSCNQYKDRTWKQFRLGRAYNKKRDEI